MKKLLFFSLLIMSIISCEKDKTSFISKYKTIAGTWTLQSISYDSSGLNISKSLPYDVLVINDNLEYKIYMDQTNIIENGTVNIITQTNKKLELYFDAKYPITSSYAGSHIFGVTNTILVLLTSNDMIFRSVVNGSLPEIKFNFKPGPVFIPM